MCKTGKFIEMEGRLVVAKGQEVLGRNGEWLTNGYEVSFFGVMKNILELDCGDSYTILNILKTIELFTSKGWIVRYVIYILMKLL